MRVLARVRGWGPSPTRGHRREHEPRRPRDPAGEIASWPLLKLVYRTDPDRIADLLPPGIEPGRNPYVHVNIYNVPVKGEPEYGVSTKVEAIFDGMDGYYGIGLGIDQESAIFISQEINGQPKFPCSIVYFRRDDAVERGARTRATRSSSSTARSPPSSTTRRASTPRTSGGSSRRARWRGREELRLPAARRARGERERHRLRGDVDGTLVLRDSPWDPYTELLPMREQVSARLVTPIHKSREITLAGPLDPIAFWPYATPSAARAGPATVAGRGSAGRSRR